VYDLTYEGGKEKRVLNQKETIIAQQRQETIGEAFRNWIFKDPERRADLCATYNRLFNAIRPREYNGDHIHFSGMNPEYKLEPHQRNAVARMLYPGAKVLVATKEDFTPAKRKQFCTKIATDDCNIFVSYTLLRYFHIDFLHNHPIEDFWAWLKCYLRSTLAHFSNFDDALFVAFQVR